MLRHVVRQLSAAVGAKPRGGSNCGSTMAASVFEALAASAAERLSHGDLSTTLRTMKRLLQFRFCFSLYNVTPRSKPYANPHITNYISSKNKAENLYITLSQDSLPFIYAEQLSCK